MPDERSKKTSNLPTDFIQLLQQVSSDWQHIVDCIMESEAYTAIKPNTYKASTQQLEAYLPTTDHVPWHRHARYVHPRPNFTLDPLFHAGAYYVQEPSGLVLDSIGLPIDRPLTVLDACAAPGGKTTTLLDLLSPGSLVVANELIPNRNATLRDTILKWGNPRCVVTRSKLEAFVSSDTRFDVVLLDAPCSGEGLWRRNPGAIDEWSLDAVHRSVHLQRQLLTQAAQLVLPDGWLVYSTCTFNNHENIHNSCWFQAYHGTGWIPQRLEHLTEFGFTECVEMTTADTSVWGYAALPHTCRGEGFYISVWRKEPENNAVHATGPIPLRLKKGKSNPVGKAQPLGLGQVEVLEMPDKQIFTFDPDVQGLLEKLASGGIHVTLGHRALGKWVGKDWVPEPDWVQLANYPQLLPDQPLDYFSALRYLARQDFAPENWTVPNGWCTVSYQGVLIGLCKKMPNRVNTTWPNRLRILQALPSVNPFEK
jgi:16S rRNA C967 or C1407 C5-methylase (RsmB/RsmF family)